MEASKVTISQDLLSKKLSRSEKRSLRKKIVKDYIRSRPYGSRITVREFANILQYKTPGEAHVLLKQMVKLGEINREPVSSNLRSSFFYIVCGDIKVTKTKNEKFDLTARTKDFLWDNPLEPDLQTAIKLYCTQLIKENPEQFE